MKKLFVIFTSIILVTSCTKDSVTEGENNNTPTVNTDKWISEIVEYKPAPGQFINSLLGSPESAKNMIGKMGDEVSLGGFGGYIVFKFNHNVKNIAGADFVIFGNAFEGSSEPGAVMVESDGKWYELKGSEYDNGINREVTYTKPATDKANVLWSYASGETGEIKHLSHVVKSYFPEWISGNTLTFKCRQTPSNNRIDEEADKWVLDSYESGYADNFSADYNDIVGGDADTKASNKFDISNAVDESGNKVTLSEITAIKVYNCTNSQSGAIGEASTEIRGAISLTKK